MLPTADVEQIVEATLAKHRAMGSFCINTQTIHCHIHCALSSNPDSHGWKNENCVCYGNGGGTMSAEWGLDPEEDRRLIEIELGMRYY